MSEEDITILSKVTLSNGNHGRVYYYKGNVFRPLGFINRKETERVNRKIAIWLRQNREMVLKDRSDPNYRTLSQLFDDQMVKYGVR